MTCCCIEEDSPYGRPTFYSDTRRQNSVESEERPLVDIIRQFLQANLSQVRPLVDIIRQFLQANIF